jgi:hypothetical protein
MPADVGNGVSRGATPNIFALKIATPGSPVVLVRLELNPVFYYGEIMPMEIVIGSIDTGMQKETYHEK